MYKHLVVLLLAGVTALHSLPAAEKKTTAASVDYPFWSSKKRGNVGELVPGLNAVLQLTDEQRQQIVAARQQIESEEPVRKARSLKKSDSSVTAEEREKARATIDEATTRLREKVSGILTDKQKTLIEKINAAYAGAVEDIGIVYADKFASVKADEAARRRIQQEKNEDTEEQFLHKLDGILSAEQREAMERAAEQAERNSEAAAAVKRVK